MTTVKRRTIEILDNLAGNDRAAVAVNLFIITLIFLNVFAMILQSVKSLEESFGRVFALFEVFSIGIFTGEYLLRMWSCTARSDYPGGLGGRIRYALRPYALIDLFTILPFFLPFLIPMDLRFLRIVRFLRIFRIFKLDRYVGSLAIIGRVIRNKRAEMLSLSASIFIIVMLSSFFMYLIESEAQPKVFSSIPMTIWWAISTLTTVGYGDMYPVTPLGRILGGFIAILGIGMFALPTSILGAGFLEELSHGKRPAACPHCGKRLDGEKDLEEDAGFSIIMGKGDGGNEPAAEGRISARSRDAKSSGA